MPIAKVQLEDGRIGRFEVPEGTTPDQVMEFVASFSKPKPMSDNGASWSGLDNFASGVLQGMGDEVKALTQATKAQFQGGPSFGNAYEQAKTMYQGARTKYREENPVTAAVTDIAGQAAPWIAAAPLMPALGAPTMMGRLLKSGATGMGIGTVSGGLNAEGDLADRAIGAGTGAVVGGAVGAVTPPVVEGISKLGREGYNQIVGRMPFQQESVAARKVAEALMRDGLTPDQAAAKMAQMGPEAALMDVGANSRGLARQAATVPGEGKSRIADFLTKRQEGVRNAGNVLQGGQSGRVTQMIDDLVPEQYRGTLDALTKARNVEAGPLYKEAFEPKFDLTGKVYAQWDDRLQQFLDDPLVKQGMNKGIRVQQLEALAEGKPFNFQEYAVKGFDPKGELIIDGTPNLRAMDAAKRGMDEILEGYRDKTTGKLVLDDMGRAIDKVRKSLVSKLDDITTVDGRSAYKEARAAYAGPSKMRDALSLGKDILGGAFKNADEVTNRIKGMTPDELHYMRIGAVQDLRDKIGNSVNRADVTKKLMDVPGLEQKIRLAFGDDAMFKKYIDGLQGEKAMFDSYGKIMGGSRTGEVLAEQADATIDPSRIMQGLQRMASSNPIDWVAGGAQALGGVKDRVLMPQPTSRKLGEILTSQNLGPIRQQYQASQLSAAQRAALSKALVAGGSSQGQ